MIALLQRVTQARVEVEDQTIAAIGPGLLALVAVERTDTEADARRLLQRLLHYRVFADADDKMNKSIVDVQGALLLVPQFTLAADTRKGSRPSFSPAASPEQSESLFNHLAAQAETLHTRVAIGRFGAHMRVFLVNDGPVTFLLRQPHRSA